MKIRALLAAIGLMALVSCGGGAGGDNDGGGPGGGGGMSANPLTEAQASRLLQQATFGATPATLDQATGMTAEAWVDQQFALGPSMPYLEYVDGRIGELGQNALFNRALFYEAWWRNAATGDDQLRQRVAFALSEIFVVSLLDGDHIRNRQAGAYYDILLNNAFGNFRDLLEDVTLSPSMGFYLTYFRNEKENADGTRFPDENYAREVMQLFTIGLDELNIDGTLRLDAQGDPIPTYSGDDIRGLAKVFTGLSQPRGRPSDTFFASSDPDALVKPMVFYPEYHSTSEKRFLGVTIPAQSTPDPEGDLRIALDALFNHPNVGPFIAQRLIQRLITSNPSPEYVARVATVFNDNGSGVRGDMRAVVRAIILDDEARDETRIADPSFGKLREPLIRIANYVRAVESRSVSGNWRIGGTSGNTQLDQSPLTAPSVFNFYRPGYTPPALTALGQRNLLAPEFQITDEVSVAGYLNYLRNSINVGLGAAPAGGPDVLTDYEDLMALVDDAARLVDRLDLLLTANQLSDSTKQVVIAELNDLPVDPNLSASALAARRRSRIRAAIFLVMSSNDYLVQR